jgi:DNA-binding NarL/FixJ family response regulator
MPGMNGFETAAHMRQIAPAVKTIFYSIHEIPTIARLSGEAAFASKSSSPEELTTTVNLVLHG